MKPIEVYDAKKQLSVADIDAAEKRLGIKLPIQYRTWLLRFNGGQPSRDAFKYKHETGPYTDSVVAWFLAIHDGTASNLELTFKTFKIMQRRLPEELVPIAHDPGGNLICISVGGSNGGKVYFWDHEEEPATPDYSNCHLIADSFDEFIEGLH